MVSYFVFSWNRFCVYQVEKFIKPVLPLFNMYCNLASWVHLQFVDWDYKRDMLLINKPSRMFVKIAFYYYFISYYQPTYLRFLLVFPRNYYKLNKGNSLTRRYTFSCFFCFIILLRISNYFQCNLLCIIHIHVSMGSSIIYQRWIIKLTRFKDHKGIMNCVLILFCKSMIY